MSSDTFFKGKNCSEQDSEGCWITYTLRWRDWGKLSSIYIDVSRVCPTTIALSVAVGVLGAAVLLLIVWIIFLKETQKIKLSKKDGARGTLEPKEAHFQEQHHGESPWWHQERQGT